MANKHIYSINGIISRTVAGNNLTVALKNFDGTNFSSSAPLIHKIGDTPRTLTDALSVTVNAGTNTFNAGSSELKTLEHDYFVYLGWRASNSSVFILISRIPYATTYGDFSVTATNEKYGAYSGAAPASTDRIVNIGRVNVQNSGTASFNWSIPATDIVINYPIYETRWLTWTPTLTGWSANPTFLTFYKVHDEELFWVAHATATGTSNATTSTLTLPFTAANVTNLNNWCVGRGQDNGVEVSPTLRIVYNTNILDAFKGPGNTAWTASGTKYFSGQGFYRII